jgi:hypothetical protein
VIRLLLGLCQACATEILTGALFHRGIHPNVDWLFFLANYGNCPLQAHHVLLILSDRWGGVFGLWRSGNCSPGILALSWAALLRGGSSSRSRSLYGCHVRVRPGFLLVWYLPNQVWTLGMAEPMGGGLSSAAEVDSATVLRHRIG